MDARAIDHVNFMIPEAGIDDALAFYRDTLGFETENLDAYREGERSLFTFRLGESCVIHVSPDEAFDAPTERNLRHVCLVLAASIDEIKRTLDEAEHDVRRESTPLGATGRNPAVYVEDPFGYVLELKAAQGSDDGS
jgi:catechol 2,3-dioxygenase-like lactoylglutathione lyase family enzyme